MSCGTRLYLEGISVLKGGSELSPADPLLLTGKSRMLILTAQGLPLHSAHASTLPLPLGVVLHDESNPGPKNVGTVGYGPLLRDVCAVSTSIQTQESPGRRGPIAWVPELDNCKERNFYHLSGFP